MSVTSHTHITPCVDTQNANLLLWGLHITWLVCRFRHVLLIHKTIGSSINVPNRYVCIVQVGKDPIVFGAFSFTPPTLATLVRDTIY